MSLSRKPVRGRKRGGEEGAADAALHTTLLAYQETQIFILLCVPQRAHNFKTTSLQR